MEPNRGNTCHRLDRRTLINEHPLVQTDLAERITYPPQHVTEVLVYFVLQRFLLLWAAALRLLCFFCRGTWQQCPPPHLDGCDGANRSVILTSWGERYRCIKCRGRKHQGRVFVPCTHIRLQATGMGYIHLLHKWMEVQQNKGGTNHNA